jgi:hypothetical protein
MPQNDHEFYVVDKQQQHTLAQEQLQQIRQGNSDIAVQLKRDIEMLSQAIVYCGVMESDKMKAHALFKSILLLYFGDLYYRDIGDDKFHSWQELKAYSNLPAFPIAAVLAHGSRVLIEFPAQLADAITDWLIIDKSQWRYAATHGIMELVETEKERITADVSKHLKEVKINPINAAFHSIAKPLAAFANSVSAHTVALASGVASADTVSSFENKTRNISQHYGIDLALGGVEHKNPFSGNTIHTNGEHGHLYIHCPTLSGQRQGLLIGIEQSAPYKVDQYGGSHDTLATEKDYSATGGDLFCKTPKAMNQDYLGLKKLPFADYYDNFWNFISHATASLVQLAYKKACFLLDFLPEEESLNFIKEILASEGKSDERKFTELFRLYFAKVQLDEVQNLLANKKENENELQKKQIEIQIIAAEQEKLQSKISRENLKNLAKGFMDSVTNHMGWFAATSRKKIILLQLKNKLSTLTEEELYSPALVWLLKNFISVALMNRYHKKEGETHSGKACLGLLNAAQYRELKELLFTSVQRSLVYQDLPLRNAMGAQVKMLSSAHYKGAMYSSFGIANTKRIAKEKLNLALQDLVYQATSVIGI